MRSVTRDTLTQAVTRSFEAIEDSRAKLLVSKLVAHLHAYAREVELTPDEWKVAIDFLYRAGRLSSEGRNEFILASDVLGLSSLIDMLETGVGSTERSALGPFHATDSPPLAVDGDAAGANPGERMLVCGRVLDSHGEPVRAAQLDFWQAATNGLYWQQDPTQNPKNLRFKMTLGVDARYAFTTVRPAPYTVPCDGPVGDLLRAARRHAWRPAHFHFIVSAANHAPVTTELFFDDDPYIDDDAVFAVREALAVSVTSRRDEAEAKRYSLPNPFPLVEYDFRLAQKEQAR